MVGGQRGPASWPRSGGSGAGWPSGRPPSSALWWVASSELCGPFIPRGPCPGAEWEGVSVPRRELVGGLGRLPWREEVRGRSGIILRSAQKDGPSPGVGRTGGSGWARGAACRVLVKTLLALDSTGVTVRPQPGRLPSAPSPRPSGPTPPQCPSLGTLLAQSFPSSPQTSAPSVTVTFAPGQQDKGLQRGSGLCASLGPGPQPGLPGHGQLRGNLRAGLRAGTSGRLRLGPDPRCAPLS